MTVGHDIYFRDGPPDAGTRRGQKLYMHELTHAAQAETDESAGLVVGVSDRRSPAENEARAMASGAMPAGHLGTSQTAPSGVAHLAGPTDEEKLEEQAPGAAAPTAKPAPAKAVSASGQPQQAAVQPAASPLLALYDTSVTKNIESAKAAFDSDPPDAATALESMSSAYAAIAALAPSYEQSDPTLAQALHRAKNYMAMIVQSIKPLAGGTITRDQIRAMLARVEGGNAMVRAKLH